MKALGFLLSLSALAAPGFGQSSPSVSSSITVGGKAVSIKYSAPSVRGRKIFGEGGILSNDPTYPAWRAGANNSTALHTDLDLAIGGLSVPKGDYTLYVWIKNPDAWDLIINKQTGQWGTEYDASKDLGRVKMTMSTPVTPVEVMKYTLADLGNSKGILTLEWEKHVASVPVIAK
jgi:hypothetical protein